MKQPLLLAGILALAIVGAAPAVAQSADSAAGQVQTAIVEQLKTQGFLKIRISRTLLGRVRIVATSDTLEREIIVNPRTGEILRDYWDQLDHAAADDTDRNRRIVSPNNDRSSNTTSARPTSSSSSREDDSHDDSNDDKNDDKNDDGKDD